MPRAMQPLSLLVLLILAVTAQGQAVVGPKELQPWLVALTAVVIFLFIIFVLLLINRLWRIRRHRKRSRRQEVQGSGRLERGGRATPAAEGSGERSGERSGEESSKVTAF